MVGITSLLGGSASVPAFLLFQSLKVTRDQQFAQLQKDPLIQRDIEHFQEAAPKITTVDEFVKDRRLLSVALSAFALDDEINLPGRIKKVLSEPVTDKNALANKLLDPRFKELATAFAFGTLGTAKLQLSTFRQDIIDRFLTNEFEKRLGKQNPAIREAEFFRRKIGAVANTFEILGNPVLRSVVTFTLDLPPQIAFQSVDKQKALIDARLDIKDFQDPALVDKFIQRFLIKKDAEAAQGGFGLASSTVGNAHLLPLFQNISGGGGLLNLLV